MQLAIVEELIIKGFPVEMALCVLVDLDAICIVKLGSSLLAVITELVHKQPVIQVLILIAEQPIRVTPILVLPLGLPQLRLPAAVVILLAEPAVIGKVVVLAQLIFPVAIDSVKADCASRCPAPGAIAATVIPIVGAGGLPLPQPLLRLRPVGLRVRLMPLQIPARLW